MVKGHQLAVVNKGTQFCFLFRYCFFLMLQVPTPCLFVLLILCNMCELQDLQRFETLLYCCCKLHIKTYHVLLLFHSALLFTVPMYTIFSTTQMSAHTISHCYCWTRVGCGQLQLVFFCFFLKVGGITPETTEIWTHICSYHNFLSLSSVQILLIPACSLLCML